MPGTTRRELGTLQAAVNYAHAQGRITFAPHVTLPDRPPGKDRWLTRDEVARLLRSARATRSSVYLPLFILLALYTGARKQAILSLRWPQIDLERGLIDFNPPGRVQSKKRRPIVPISPRLLTFLRHARRRGSDLGYVLHVNGRRIKDVKHGFRAAAARAGLSAVTAHTLRHTCGTWLAQRGVAIWQISGFLGHSSERTSSLYMHHSPDYLKDASNALGRK
jgi:integrase